MKWLVDQRFGFAHFDAEEIRAKHAEVGTVRFLSELYRLLLAHDEPNVCTLRYILYGFFIRCVVHQLEKVFLWFISAMRPSHVGVMLEICGDIVYCCEFDHSMHFG